MVQLASFLVRRPQQNTGDALEIAGGDELEGNLIKSPTCNTVRIVRTSVGNLAGEQVQQQRRAVVEKDTRHMCSL